jgi:hypothetical protein
LKTLKILCLTALLTIGCSFGVIAKTDAQRAAVEQLITLTKQDQIMDQMYDQVKQLVLQQVKQLNPAPEQSPLIEKYLNKIFAVMQAEMSWDKMKEDFIQLYLSFYTEPEIQDLIAFYQTPTGRKTIEKMPLLMQQSMAIGQKYSLNMMPKIEKLIEEMAAEIRK